MYERFTDRAKKIFQLANSQAQRFQHEYIGTEHVLLGLVLEGTGVAATVLKQMGVSLTQIRTDVEEQMISGPSRTRGKFPITPLIKKVIAHAIFSARELGHNYVGSEHLLLGLLHVNQGIASQALRNLGVTSAKAIAGIKSILGVRETPVSHDAGEYNPYAPPREQDAAIFPSRSCHGPMP
jgi:ATP-dependent Clp protease ATP-binding subunit ClpC